MDGKTSDGRISFPLSLTDPSRVAAIQIWFTTDGSDVSVSGLGGFTPVGAISTSQVNGQTRQSSNTGDMIFSVAQIIADLSRHFTLMPGDLIFTMGAGDVWQVADLLRD